MIHNPPFALWKCTQPQSSQAHFQKSQKEIDKKIKKQKDSDRQTEEEIDNNAQKRKWATDIQTEKKRIICRREWRRRKRKVVETWDPEVKTPKRGRRRCRRKTEAKTADASACCFLKALTKPSMRKTLMSRTCKSGMLSLLNLEDAFTMKCGFCVIWCALSSQQFTCCELMNCFLEERGQMDGILSRQESYYYCILPMSLSTLVDSIWTLRARRNGLIIGKKLLKMHY